MNYYERHLGDYAKDAGHLSMLEHGAYTLLLDRYYTTEQPIPADQAHRVCRARSKEERAAVDAVLAEFFVLDGAVYRNGRADREITKMQAKVKAAQENGKRGGRPKRTEQKPSGFQLGSESVTQQKAHQSPVTSNQETPPNPRKRGQDDPPGFARFWAAWPASTRKAARQQCVKRWERGELEPMADRIVAAVEAFKASADWLKDAGEFIPAPLVWLNQSRWEAVEALPVVAPVTASANEELARQREQQARAVPPPPEVLARLRGVVKVFG